jgi:1-phosphatidylinositol-4-phosphate 5-kinase
MASAAATPQRMETRSRSLTVQKLVGKKEKYRGPGKHKKINKDHPEFELTYDMMLGIRTTVSKAEAVPDRALTDEDFTVSNSLTFPAKGSNFTPAHEMRNFKFKDYAPDVFRQIRERFGIDASEYLLCVCGNFKYLEFISNSKSGQFFFYSHDRKYMIKTVSQAECKFLRKILPDYYHHIMTYPNTLLTRFYGMHRVKPHKKKEVHFLIMGSIFFTKKYIHTIFDLKGSTQGRAATKKERQKEDTCVYKDLDFLEAKTKISIGPVRAQLLMEQLAVDTKLLCENNIMDYSLLLGVHYKDKGQQQDEGSDDEASKSRRRELSRNANDGEDEKQVVADVRAHEVLHSGSSDSDADDTGDLPMDMTPRMHRGDGPVWHAGNNRPPAQRRQVRLVDAPEAQEQVIAQSAYGLPKSWDKKSRPEDINFEADFESWVLVKDVPTQRARPVAVESIFTKEDGGCCGQLDDGRPSKEIYYMGIIDILVEYSAGKKIEHAAKTLKYDGHDISAVNPNFYARRFQEFLKKALN